MALIDKAKKLQEEAPAAEETAQHEAMPGDDAEDMSEGEPEGSKPGEQEGEQKGQTGSITVEKIGQMQQALMAKVPPQMKGAFDRIVLAGKKVMYDPRSSDLVKRELERQAPIDEKLAKAGVGLVAILKKEAKGTMPPDAAVLAGAYLVLEMADFVVQIGTAVSSQDVRDALDQYMALSMMAAGAGKDQIMGAITGQQAPAAPQAPMQPQQMPMQGGMPA